MTTALIVSTAAVILFGGSWAVYRIRNAKINLVNLGTPRAEPASLVRVLCDDGELRRAVARAAEYDRKAAELARTRAEHYDRLIFGVSTRHIANTGSRIDAKRVSAVSGLEERTLKAS